MSTQRVYLFNSDITEFVVDIPNLTITAGEYGQVTVAPLTGFTGNNARGFWDKRNQASPFYGATDFSTYGVRVENDGQTVFDGSILDILPSAQDRTADVQLRTPLMTALESGCVYASDDFNGDDDTVSPAKAISQILTQYSIPFDPGSFAAADTYYSSFNVDIRVVALGNQSIMSMIQRIAEIGIARVYLSDNLVRLDVYNPDLDLAPLYTFSDFPQNPDGCTFLVAPPNPEPIQKDKITGYSVEWATPNSALWANFGDDTALKKTISAGADSDIQIVDSDTAVWVGAQWLAYMQRPQDLIRWTTRSVIGKQLSLGYPVALQYSRWGSSAITVDLVSINNASAGGSELIGVTR